MKLYVPNQIFSYSIKIQTELIRTIPAYLKPRELFDHVCPNGSTCDYMDSLLWIKITYLIWLKWKMGNP
mgnify:CR=1 FL=1